MSLLTRPYKIKLVQSLVLSLVQFLPFITKCILGIKRIFPRGFGNKHMRLLTCVYSICTIRNR